jgi:hypothetical protein
VAVVVGCGADQPIFDAPARLPVFTKAAYDSLPLLTLKTLSALCASDSSTCVLDYSGLATANRDGAVLMAGFARFQQLTHVSGHPPVQRPVGRLGAGPGEYRTLNALGFAPSGSLLALDVLQQRVLRYAADGRIVSTSIIPIPPGFIAATFVGDELHAVATEAAKHKGDSVPVSVFALDSGKRAPRRLYSLPVRQKSYSLGDMIPVPQMFAAHAQWVVCADGRVVHTSGDAFAVDEFDASGRHVLRFGFDVTPRAVTSEDVERRTAATLRRIADPSMRGAIRNQWGHPAARHPAITWIKCLENGQTWVREAERAAGDSVRWVVFAPGGKPIGAVVMETDAMVVAAHDSLVLISSPAESSIANTLRWVAMQPGTPRTPSAR